MPREVSCENNTHNHADGTSADDNTEARKMYSVFDEVGRERRQRFKDFLDDSSGRGSSVAEVCAEMSVNLFEWQILSAQLTNRETGAS